MKHISRLTFIAILASASSMATAQPVPSNALQLRARQKTDVVVPFRVADEGVATPIEWGLDLAWLSEENIHRGINFAGKDLIDIIRTSYMPTDSVPEDKLSSAQISKIRQRVNIIKRYAKAGVALNLNDDHASVSPWYNVQSIGSTGRGQRWAKVIDLHIKKYAELGLTNFVSISAYNEPDYGWDQGYSNTTRKADFLATVKSLREDYDGAYDGVRMCGGNTLNCDQAYPWWNYLKAQLDEGNTHQLAGGFDAYASFFQRVRDYGHHATADELHNTMEAMVGVEYGMQTGIWWGTCEHSRSQFMKATWQGNPGRRLAYGEHRANWTSAAVYRLPDGRLQAFGGTSERQAVESTYNLVSLDRPVWFDGLPGREYVMHLPGGTGYQTGQTNAETVIDLQSGPDVQPHIDGTYKIMNVGSGLIMGFSSTPTNWTSVTQKKNGTGKYLQWQVKPVAETIGGDFSYYSFTLNAGSGMVLDILNWNMEAGADVGAYKGGLGTNEQWFLEYADSGAFYIRSRFSAKCLEVKGASKATNANIQMGDLTGGKHQQWRFIPTDAAPDLIAPDSPTDVEVKANSCSVSLKWTPSGAKDVASYTILRSQADADDFYTIATNVEGCEFTDNEADEDKEYVYQVRAVDKSLNYSQPAASAPVMLTAEHDLAMCLPFDQDLFDTTIHGNHSAIWGDTTLVAGKVGTNAISLNGSDNFIQLPYGVANHQAITVACWVYWRGGNTWQRIWDFGNGTSQYMFLCPSSGSGVRFAIKNGGDEQQVSYSKRITPNTWVHVALTLGDEGAALYVDGEQVSSNPNVTIRPADIRPVMNYIGRSQFAADPLYKGQVDDFRIYNYALSADEVRSIAELTDGIEDFGMKVNDMEGREAFDLTGRRIARGSKGIHIMKGRKHLQP